MKQLLVCALLFATPVLAGEKWEEKVKAFTDKTLAERRKLGLDKLSEAEAAKKFPTPEVTFGGAGSGAGSGGGGAGAEGLIILCPGQPKPVALKGNFPAGALVVVASDEVEVSKESGAAGSWSGTLTAKKSAAPRLVSMQTIIPLSGQRATTSGLLIGCKFTLTAVVEGAALTVKGELKAPRQTFPGEWKKGATVLGTRPTDVILGAESLTLEAQLSQQDLEKRGNASMDAMRSPKAKELEQKMQAVSKKMEACGKVPPAQMAKCFEGPGKEMKALSAEQAALLKQAEAAGGLSFGCARIDALLSEGGKAQARDCAGHASGDEVPAQLSWTSP